MDDRELTDKSLGEQAAARGALPSIIKGFGIRGLYGYRTISMESGYAATVLIARNGTGKTTLLGALDAFLRLQVQRLQNIEFDEIYCEIRDVPEPLVLTHADVADFLDFSPTPAISRISKQAGISLQEAFSVVIGDYRASMKEAYDVTTESPASKIIRSFHFILKDAEQIYRQAVEELVQDKPKLAYLHATITSALSDYEVVYLPTYRRVELALKDDSKRESYRPRARPKFSVAPGGLHTGEIQFGLLDISDRLKEINRDITLRSNSGYRALSENIINELINGYEGNEGARIPSLDDLNLFFSRLESTDRMFGPYYPISAPDFAKIYSGEGVPADSRKFLLYFLGKLSEVIDATKAIEQPVKEFVASCNKYLTSDEPSTQLGEAERKRRLSSYDGKALRMNPHDLTVDVQSLPALRSISLDALSSGEKQMISLLAKLYLYPKKKIVLIDEPELSLSIDWQRGILVDVMLAPLCEQVIAITHSPFIFENPLQPFAKSMKLSIDRERQAALFAIDSAGVDSDD